MIASLIRAAPGQRLIVIVISLVLVGFGLDRKSTRLNSSHRT